MSARCVALWVLVVVLVAGCNRGSDTAPVAPAPSVQPAGPPPTEEESRRFASELESAMCDGDAVKVGSLLRLDDLIARSISDVDLPTDVRERFLKGAQAGQTGGQGLPAALVAKVKNGGSYKFRKYYATGAKPHVLFRMLNADGRSNYHDIVLARHADGRVGMEDVYVLVAGEMLSQTYRRPMLALLPALNKNFLSRLSPVERDYVDN